MKEFDKRRAGCLSQTSVDKVQGPKLYSQLPSVRVIHSIHVNHMKAIKPTCTISCGSMMPL